MLGQSVGDLYYAQVKRRVIVGPLPALVFCDNVILGICCRGVWRNPAWTINEDVGLLLSELRALPLGPRPRR